MPTPTSPGPRSPSPYSSVPSTISQQIQEELVDLLSKAAEDTNTLSSKVLLLHPSTSPPTFSPTSPIPPEPLHLEPFILTFTTSWSFILSGEVLSSRMIVGLRGVLTGLAKQWLSEMHKRNMSEVVGKGVEEELWNPVPNVGVAVQEEGVDWICESATRDLPALKVTPGGQPPSTADVTNGNPTGADAPPPRKHLEIEGTKFFLVPCTELLIKTLLQSYIRLIINIPILTIDSMSRVIEFLKVALIGFSLLNSSLILLFRCSMVVFAKLF
jgi:vacuolar protein sorting-associated protein 54